MMIINAIETDIAPNAQYFNRLLTGVLYNFFISSCGPNSIIPIAYKSIKKRDVVGRHPFSEVITWRSDRDSNSGYAFGVYTLSRQLSPIANDWLIISCLKPVPACAYVARKIYAAKLIIFFDVAITFAPFLSFFFLNVRDSIGC